MQAVYDVSICDEHHTVWEHLIQHACLTQMRMECSLNRQFNTLHQARRCKFSFFPKDRASSSPIKGDHRVGGKQCKILFILNHLLLSTIWGGKNTELTVNVCLTGFNFVSQQILHLWWPKGVSASVKMHWFYSFLFLFLCFTAKGASLWNQCDCKKKDCTQLHPIFPIFFLRFTFSYHRGQGCSYGGRRRAGPPTTYDFRPAQNPSAWHYVS